MSSSTSHPPRRLALAVTALAVPLLATSIARADGPAAAHVAGPQAPRIDLSEDRGALDDFVLSPPLSLASAEAEERPVEVPLPPALGTGLAGLGAMAALRVGHRVYRRR